MPPEIPPPDDERGSSPHEGNVVDPEVLAERRAQRAEQAEQSAARRAADAQVLAAQLARERARIEAERDAARAEAAAAREGADAAIAEAQHLQAERDALRAELERGGAARSAPGGEPAAALGGAAPETAAEPLEPHEAPAPEHAPLAPATANGGGRGANGHVMLPLAWPAALRHELTVARASAVAAPLPKAPALLAPVPGLAAERRLLARRGAAGPAGAPLAGAGIAPERRGGRAAPVTALALERERSSRLQAQLDNSLAVQRELRTHIAALQRAVHQRVEAERRIEAALRRVREELTAANVFAAQRTGDAPVAAPVPAAAAPVDPPRAAAGTAAPSVAPSPPAPAPRVVVPPASAAPAPSATPTVPSPAPSAPPAAEAPAPAAERLQVPPARPQPQPPTESPVAGLDPQRLSAAHERLRAAAAAATPPLEALPAGTPAPWLAEAMQRLLASEPELAGRIAVGLLPAQGLAAQRPLRYDLLLAGHGCLAVDVEPGDGATVTPRAAPRPRGARDLAIAGDAAGFARLLHGRRALLRRPARVRGGRKALRELRRLARAPLGLRDLAAAGIAPESALALRLVALAIDPAATQGERFAVAHVPLAGGPLDAWLRIADGAAPAVCETAPSEPTRLTLRCTRGALLPLIAGVALPPGEAGALEGDEAALALLRRWIAQTEHPAA